MNVFKWLGCEERPSNKVVQLVKDFESREKWVERTLEDNYYYAQVKKDGVYAMVVIDSNGECSIFGRTGKRLTSVGLLESSIEDWADIKCIYNQVIICELVCEDPACSLEMLSGIVNPNRTTELTPKQVDYATKFNLYAHDLIEVPEFKAGVCHVPYQSRYRDLLNLVGDSAYFTLLEPTILDSVRDMRIYAGCYIDRGEEGAVFKDPMATWVAGRKNEVAVKIVKGVDYDLQVVGVEYGRGGTKREGQVSKLVVRWKGGKELPVDGRFTDGQRIAWAKNPELILGKIVHVHALQEGSKGALRLPKVRTIRFDKEEADL